MSKKLAFGSIWILAYVLCGLFLFLQKNDPVPEGFKLSGRGTLPWNESPQTLTVFQETEQLMLTILEPDFPKIIQKSEISGAKLLLRVANGNPTKIFGMLKTNGDILIINQNGIIVSPNVVMDIQGTAVFSEKDIEIDNFINGGDNRFRGTGSVTNYGTIKSKEGYAILLGNFVDSLKSNQVVGVGAGEDLIILDKLEKTTFFEFNGLEQEQK